jgi:16S rRNA (uracil1498-N3)-methyltransferase
MHGKNSFFQKPRSKISLAYGCCPKMNDRFELFLEKATEIGIHEITPIICDRLERKVINNERFDKIIFLP